MRFSKWQGLGNHHLIVDSAAWPFPITPERARILCNPNTGVGGDGVLEIALGGRTPEMIVWNADGSNSESCGNGIRMVARYLADRGLLGADGAILTGGGTVTATVLPNGRVRVDMGVATLPGGGTLEHLSGPGAVDFLDVNMGNPHAVIDHADPGAVVTTLGPTIEIDPRFPERTNVEFVRADGPGEVTMRVWERGVGETMACGTGACAVAVAAVHLHGAPSPVTVHLLGGDLIIDVDESDLRVTMTGPAEAIYDGELSARLVADLMAAV